MGSKWVGIGFCVLAWGCGPAVTLDDAGESDSASSTGSTSMAPTTATTMTTAVGTSSVGSSDGDPDTTVGPQDTTAGSDDDDDDDATDTTDSGEDSTDTGEPIKCDPPDAVAALPNLWVANATEGTVSRIDTENLVETGRFIVRPDSAGSPSRTAVAFNGDMAVANRNGGVTKIYANVEHCQDTNGLAGIQTSTDSTALAWGTEECIAWHTPFSYVSNRPLAWTPGVLNEETCQFEESNVWTSGTMGGVGEAEVLLLDGETGAVMQTVVLDEVASGIGLYGGAVDGDGNFWGVENPTALYRVDAEDFSVQRWGFDESMAVPGYGITVDAQGRPLTCGGGHAALFNEAMATWQTTPNSIPSIGGCATDGQGTLWHSDFNDGGTVVEIDIATMTISQTYDVPEYFHGLSVDFDGMVWGVPIGGSSVYRLDPATGNVDTLTGFTGLYTYSDMTGLALAAVSGYVE